MRVLGKAPMHAAGVRLRCCRSAFDMADGSLAMAEHTLPGKKLTRATNGPLSKRHNPLALRNVVGFYAEPAAHTLARTHGVCPPDYEGAGLRDETRTAPPLGSGLMALLRATTGSYWGFPTDLVDAII